MHTIALLFLSSITTAQQEEKQTIIVSFTTIDSRINYIKPMVDSILSQTVQPDRLEVYLSDHPSLFIGGIDQGIPPDKVPQFLRDYEKQRKLTLKYTDNIGPARKLIPCLQENWGTNNIIITVDDDVIYPSHTIENLVTAYKQHGCVITMRGKQPTFNKYNVIEANYLRWHPLKHQYKDLHAFITGAGGVLYKTSFFSEKVLNIKMLLETCPLADDIWFHFCRTENRTPAFIFGLYANSLPEIDMPNKKSLWQINVGHNQNDVAINKMLRSMFFSKHSMSIEKI